MAYGKYKAPTKKMRGSRWLIVVLLLVVMLIGRGVNAYLSVAASPATSQLASAIKPKVTVTDDYCVKVENPKYSVFLRANIVVAWENIESGNILAEMPEAGKDYELSLVQDGKWHYHSDGFYYYKEEVQTDTVTDPVISFNALTEKEGYVLSVRVIAQSIQAAGKTDDNTKTAVEDAWGIDASQFITAP